MDKKTLHVTGKSSGIATEVTARNHTLIIDEPEELGGKNTGANPLEYVLAALSGCVNVMIHFVAKELDFDFEETSFEIDGTFDARGLQGEEGIRPYFEEIKLIVNIKTEEDEDSLDELQRIIDKRCPVYTMLEAANIKLNTVWNKV